MVRTKGERKRVTAMLFLQTRNHRPTTRTRNKTRYLPAAIVPVEEIGLYSAYNSAIRLLINLFLISTELIDGRRRRRRRGIAFASEKKK